MGQQIFEQYPGMNKFFEILSGDVSDDSVAPLEGDKPTRMLVEELECG